MGKYNRFVHPSPKVIQKLEAPGAQTYHTDQEGYVWVITDGNELTVETYEGIRIRGNWALVPWF